METTLDLFIGSNIISRSSISFLPDTRSLYSYEMSRRGSRKGKAKEPDQFAVSQPTVADVFDKLSTRSGKMYQREPHMVKPLKTKHQRPASVGFTGHTQPVSPLSSPVRTTSTEAVDTEEGQEITKYLTEEAVRKQRRASVSIMQETEDYENDLPQPSRVAIPPPRKQEINQDNRPASVQIDTSRSVYEELDLFSRLGNRSRPVSQTRSARQTPQYFERTQGMEEGLSDTVKKAPMPSTGSAFVHYSKAVLDMLDRQTPRLHRGMQRAFSETLFPPIVYGITPEESPDEKNKPKLQITQGGENTQTTSEVAEVSLPMWTTETPVCTTNEPLTQFTQTIQGNSVVTVPAVSLVADQVKTVDTQKPIGPDFYLPDGVRLSNTTQYKTSQLSPEGNPMVNVKLSSLKEKYETDMFLLDRYSGHLYVPNKQGVYTIIEEKGWIFPTESMLSEPLAGNLSVLGSTTPQSLHLTGMDKPLKPSPPGMSLGMNLKNLLHQ